MSKLRHEQSDEGLNAASGLPKATLVAPGPLKARRAPQALPSFYTIGQVAEALGVSTRTVRRWIANGALAVHRFDGAVVRIADRDLLGFLAVHREG
jgi:excisionase family DNA binding protein